MKTSLSLLTLVVLALSNSSANAQVPGGGPRGGMGGRPPFDMLLKAFDSDNSGDLDAEEVPYRVWTRLSQADSDDNGVVTRKEFESFGRP
ncbi:MAG: hypothetical protein U0930_07885 [Pirellulales bacterium]